MKKIFTAQRLVLAAFALTSTVAAEAQINAKPNLGLEHPNGRTVVLTLTAQQTMGNTTTGSKWTTANLNIRLDPNLLTVGSTPLQVYDETNTPITYTNNDGFLGYDLADAFDPNVVYGVTGATPSPASFFRLQDKYSPAPSFPGDDRYYYMRFNDNASASGISAPLANGQKVNLLTIVFPVDWSCNNCVQLVQTDVPGTTNVNEDPYLGNVGAIPAGSSIHAFGAVTVSPLPITLVSFDAIKSGKAQGTLKWVTGQEKNSSHFEVEHSANSKSWSLLTKVAASGSSDGKSYSTLDNAPFDGDNYYRIKMVDLDGTFKYTEVRKLNFDGRFVSSVTVMKNPFADFTEIKVSADAAQSATYTVTDATGRVVMYGKWDVAAGDNKYNLNLEGFASGTYLLAVKGASVEGQVKLLKVE